jgi:hypothetical protein
MPTWTLTHFAVYSNSLRGEATIGEAFHVAVTQRAAGGGDPFMDGTEIGLNTTPAIYSPGAEAEVTRMFPEGLTMHGQRYMAQVPPQERDWPSWAAESFFEAVRQADFPGRLSRMQSVFGFESIGDARAFIGTHRAGRPCAIYRLRGEVAHKANMSLLELCNHPGAVTFELARSYWRGEPGPRPVLWELLLRPPVTCVELVEPIVK